MFYIILSPSDNTTFKLNCFIALYGRESYIFPYEVFASLIVILQILIYFWEEKIFTECMYESSGDSTLKRNPYLRARVTNIQELLKATGNFILNCINTLICCTILCSLNSNLHLVDNAVNTCCIKWKQPTKICSLLLGPLCGKYYFKVTRSQSRSESAIGNNPTDCFYSPSFREIQTSVSLCSVQAKNVLELW